MKRRKNYIEELIEQGEHDQLDFKFAVNDARKIARSLVAFANTKGGRLLIGVKDNGKIAGVHSDEEYHMIEAAAAMYCKPEIKFDYKSWNVKGKQVLEIFVEASDEKPFYALDDEGKWLVWLRFEDQNILANAILIKAWKLMKSPQGVVFRYDNEEQALLRFLEEKPGLDFKTIKKQTLIPYKQLLEMLADLIAMNVVKMKITDKEITYSLDPAEA